MLSNIIANNNTIPIEWIEENEENSKISIGNCESMTRSNELIILDAILNPINAPIDNNIFDLLNKCPIDIEA